MLGINKKLFLFAIGLLFSLSFAAHAEAVTSLFHHAGDPVAGNPNGNITVVEFFDYQCGHCVSMAPVMQTIIKSNPNVRVVFKEFPIRGPMSELASRAALAANKQGKYYQFSHALLSANQPLTEEMIFSFAKSAGLDIAKLKSDMHSSTITNELHANANLAQELNINGTPAFFIGKTNARSASGITFVLGEMSQTELQDAINKTTA